MAIHSGTHIKSFWGSSIKHAEQFLFWPSSGTHIFLLIYTNCFKVESIGCGHTAAVIVMHAVLCTMWSYLWDLSEGLILCSTHHVQLWELINNSVKAGPKHKGSWFSYQSCCSPYRSITVIMIDLSPCFTITVMTFINVLRWSNCPGRARLS